MNFNLLYFLISLFFPKILFPLGSNVLLHAPFIAIATAIAQVAKSDAAKALYGLPVRTMCPDDGFVVVRNSELLCGVLDKVRVCVWVLRVFGVFVEVMLAVMLEGVGDGCGGGACGSGDASCSAVVVFHNFLFLFFVLSP